MFRHSPQLKPFRAPLPCTQMIKQWFRTVKSYRIHVWLLRNQSTQLHTHADLGLFLGDNTNGHPVGPHLLKSWSQSYISWADGNQHHLWQLVLVLVQQRHTTFFVSELWEAFSRMNPYTRATLVLEFQAWNKRIMWFWPSRQMKKHVWKEKAWGQPTVAKPFL